MPDMTKEKIHTICNDTNGFMIYVEDYHCLSEVSTKEVREAAKSFFSGHSSFSFYCATFLIVFLHGRLSAKIQATKDGNEELFSTGRGTGEQANRCLRICFRGFRVTRPFVQFGIFILAFYISLTRVSDYKHHPGDVMFGSFVGFLFALILLAFVIKIFDNPVAFFRNGNQPNYMFEKKSIDMFIEQTKVNSTAEPFPMENIK